MNQEEFIQCGKCQKWVQIKNMPPHFQSNHVTHAKLSKPEGAQESISESSPSSGTTPTPSTSPV